MIGKSQGSTLDDNVVLNIKGRIFVPRVDGLIGKLLLEAHDLQYSIHSVVSKMYRYLK